MSLIRGDRRPFHYDRLVIVASGVVFKDTRGDKRLWVQGYRIDRRSKPETRLSRNEVILEAFPRTSVDRKLHGYWKHYERRPKEDAWDRPDDLRFAPLQMGRR